MALFCSVYLLEVTKRGELGDTEVPPVWDLLGSRTSVSTPHLPLQMATMRREPTVATYVAFTRDKPAERRFLHARQWPGIECRAQLWRDTYLIRVVPVTY